MKKILTAILLIALLLTGCSTSFQQEVSVSPPPSSWLPVLAVESVSPTGAVLVFRQEHDLGTSLVLSGNDYLLENQTAQGWEPLPKLTEEVNFITNAFVVSAIPREEVDWQWLYGILPPGDYRIGKNVTLHHNTENLETATVYAQFRIPGEQEPPLPAKAPPQEEGNVMTAQGTDLPVYGPLEELPGDYDAAQAAADSAVILLDGFARKNQAYMHIFAQKTAEGQVGTLRIFQESSSGSGFQVYDLTFDGVHYTLCWMENGKLQQLAFKHLQYYPGDPYAEANAVNRYVLTMDANISWDDIQWGMVSQNPNDAVAHRILYQEAATHSPQIPLPANSTVSLMLQGKTVLEADEFQARQLSSLISQAWLLSERPDIYYRGLDLVFTGADGHTVSLWLDIYGDVLFYDGSYYSYSTEQLLTIFGLEAWPEEVLFAHP